MFTKQNNSVSSPADKQQEDQYIRTMKKDLAGDVVAFSAPADKPAPPAYTENHITETQSSPNAMPQNAAPAMDATSPFSKNYFENDAASAPANVLPPKNSPDKPTIDSPLPPAGKTLVPPQDMLAKPSRRYGKIITLVVSVFILVAIIAGGYIYWQSGISPQITQLPAQEEIIPQPEPEPVKVNPLAEKYSSQNPNYLSIDANTATPESIRQTLTSTADEIKQSGIASPVGFVVTDKNNNPIAFHIFCALAKINLPPSLLSKLGDAFSLYFYSDAGIVRMGTSITAKDKTSVAQLMKSSEKNLGTILSPLLLEDAIGTQALPFKDASYNGFSIRYANLNPDLTLSIDYAVDEKALFVGTSKNTLRAILDKSSQGAVSAKEQSSLETTAVPVAGPINDTAATASSANSGQ